jgi:hypothetical protein
MHLYQKMKTNFNSLSKEIYEFEKKAGFVNTSKKQLIKWLEEEIKNYQKAKTKVIKKNKLLDIIVLVMQISRRENISLDDGWERWWKKSQKYLRRRK